MSNEGQFFWERIRGYYTENKPDARWKLRKVGDNRCWGGLRIVGHPDLNPGELRAVYSVVDEIKPKSKEDVIKTIEDYQMEITELEVFSVDEDRVVTTTEYVDQMRNLQELFGVKIFETK